MDKTVSPWHGVAPRRGSVKIYGEAPDFCCFLRTFRIEKQTRVLPKHRHTKSNVTHGVVFPERPWWTTVPRKLGTVVVTEESNSGNICNSRRKSKATVTWNGGGLELLSL